MHDHLFLEGATAQVVEAGIYHYPVHPAREGACIAEVVYLGKYFQEAIVEQLFGIEHAFGIPAAYL
jgi:hypothetical protein